MACLRMIARCRCFGFCLGPYYSLLQDSLDEIVNCRLILCCARAVSIGGRMGVSKVHDKMASLLMLTSIAHLSVLFKGQGNFVMSK